MDDDDIKVKLYGFLSQLKEENWLQLTAGGMAALKKLLFGSIFIQQHCNYLTIIQLGWT